MTAPDDLDMLRRRVNDMLVDGLPQPVGGAQAAAESPDVESLAPSAADAPFEVALRYPERIAVRGAMAAAGADKMLDETLGRMTGGRFGREQLHILEDRALQNAESDDKAPLSQLAPGDPVMVDLRQKAIIDRLMRQSGSDPLGQAAQKAYDEAWRNGKIRLRRP